MKNRIIRVHAVIAGLSGNINFRRIAVGKLEKIKQIISECEQDTKYMRNRPDIVFLNIAAYQEIRDLLGLKVQKVYSIGEMKT